MATTFTGLRVQDTYNAILKIGDNSNLSGTAKILSDGVGNGSSIYLSTTRFGIGITPAYQFHTSGNAKIGGNLIISGDLTVNGSTTIIDSTIIAIGDNMIEMAKDNVANTKDIGWYGTIVETGTKYAGMAYDASTGVTAPKFNLGLGTVEPGNTFATTVTGTLIANLEGNVTGGTISGTTGTFTGLVTGIAPTADLNFATKKYVDDSIPVVPSTPALSAVLAVGNESGANDLLLLNGSSSRKLQFANDAITRKIVLYQGADNDYQFYGFGIESSTLVYSTYSNGDDHVFFVGVDSTSRSELMRIKSTGDVIVKTGLHINTTSAVSGTQVAIVGNGSTNLQRWGTSSDGGSQDSYRFRIDQNMKFIANSGSGDNLTIFSDTGNLTTIGQITAVQSTFTRGSSGYTIRLDSSDSTVDNDLRFAKGGTDYGAIQTNADTTHNFEFYVNDGTNWLKTLYFDRAYGTAEVPYTLRVGGDSAISTGVGLEFRYISGSNESRVISYDRGNSLYKGLRLIASTIDFETSGNIFSKFNHTFSYISNTDSGNHAYTNLGGRLLTSNGTNWDADGRDPILTLSSSGNSDSTEIANSIGLNLYSNSNDDNTFSPAIAFSGLSNSSNYASTYGMIIGKKTGQANDSNWNAGELQFYTGKVGAYMSNVPDLRIDSAGNAYFAASITVAGGTVFNSNLTVQGNLTVDGTTLLKSNTKITNTGDVEYLTLNTTSTENKRIRLQFTQNDNNGIEIGTDYAVNNSSNIYIYDRVAGDLMAYFATDKSYFPVVLGIGTDSPTRGLTIAKSNEYASLEIIKSNSGNQIVYLGTGSSGAGENPILQMKEATVEKIRLYASGNSWIDGGNLGIGTGSTIDSKLHVQNGSAGSVTAYTNTTLTLESSASDNFLSFLSPAGENQGILFGDADANWRGQFRYDHGTDAMQLYTAATSALNIDSSQNSTFYGDVTADYGFFNAESLSQDLRVGGIYGNLGLYIPDTYDMQFSIGSTASNWKFTLANITKFLITPNGDVTANGTGTFGSTLTVNSPAAYSGSTFRMQTATGSSSYYLDFKPADEGASGITWEMHQQTGGSAYSNTLKFIQGRTGLGKSPDSAYRLDVNGLTQVVGGMNLVATTSTLYSTDGALSYYAAGNGVYLNGAGANGWLRLQASGVENDQNSINIYGSAGNYMNFRTANVTRLTIDSNGDFQASVDDDKNYNFGKAHIGYVSYADHAGFSHIDMTAAGNYALLQDSGGTTFLNAGNGQTVRIRQNNSDKQTFSGDYFGLRNTTPQFYLHSNNSVTIPNNRYLNFNGTGETEIAQGAFKQALVCSFNTSTATSQPKNIGIILHNDSTQDNNFTPMLAFGAQSNSTGYSQVVAGIAGKRLGQAGDSNWSAGELWFWTGRSDTIGGANQGLPAAYPAMVMSSTRHIGIGTNTPTQGKLEIQQTATTPALWVQTGGTTSSYTVADFRTGTNASALRILGNVETIINSLGFKANRINSGYETAADNNDIWINYEGYLNSNSYYRDFRVGNGRNGQIMHWHGVTNRVAIGENASSATAKFQVLHNGNNGSGGDSNYGILAKSSTAGQATIGAINTGDGYANLNLGSNASGLKFWHISKRTSSDAHRIEMYYNAGSFVSLYKFGTGGEFYAAGSITSAGDVIAFSDKRVKTNIKTIDNGLEKVLNLRGVSYNRTDVDDKSNKIGVIAQEVKKVLPEVVIYNEDDDKYGVDYGKMAGVFIEAIKELKAEVDSLKQEIKELKK